jgi:LPXTG-motif cell wall-anchored protein
VPALVTLGLLLAFVGVPTEAPAAAGPGDTVGLFPEDGTIDVPAAGDPVDALTLYGSGTAVYLDLPALTDFEWAGVSSPDDSCRAIDEFGTAVDDLTFFPTRGAVQVEAFGTVCTVRVSAPAGTAIGTTEEVTVFDAASGSSRTYTLRADGVVAPPANDSWAAAEDLSSLAVPAYVAGPDGRPVNTVSVTGTTLGASREPFEYGTVENPDGTETPPPNGTVWYRFTAPQGGFAGRLGYRVSPGFDVTPLVPRRPSFPPMPHVDGSDFAPGNSWPPSSLSFVRMEPGHTVWFQVQARVDDTTGTPVWTDGEFTLELYQAPNEQDSIANAYSITGADVAGTAAPRPWPDPFNWAGDGDTFHLTPDQPGGPPTSWFTAVFDRAGSWGFRATSENVRDPSVRPLGLRLYRVSTPDPAAPLAAVTDPLQLTLVATGAGGVEQDGFGRDQYVVELVDVPVLPGRYYWSVDEGSAGATYYSLFSTFRGSGGGGDTTSPTITITGITPGSTVTATAEPTVTIASDEPLAIVDCTLDIVRDVGGSGSSDLVACGLGSFTFPELPDGSVTLTVFGRDAAGNDTTVTLSFFVSVPPTVTITAPADGATYTTLTVPALAYTCTDNDGVATFLEAQLLSPSGWVPLEGAPPSTPGTHTIAVLCEDAAFNEGRAEATYTVSDPTIIDVRTVDMDGQPVAGACYAIDLRFGNGSSSEITRTCDAAAGPNADGAADGVARFADGRDGEGSYFLRNVSLPPLRYPIPDRSLIDVPVQQTTTITIYTYRCAGTCLRVQPRLGDGTEPTFPLWPLGVPKDLVQPVPETPPGATSPPPFPTAFVVPDLTPGVTTDIPVVADDFGRAPLEVGRIRVPPTAGLNTLDPFPILPAHTINVNLQRPDGSPLTDGGACLQLRGVSPVRAARVLCTEAGSPVLRWRALPGFYSVEVPPGTVLPGGLVAPVLPANVPDTQSERNLDLTFRASQGGTVTVAPLNFQFAPIAQLPAVAAPACEIGLFLLVDGTQAAAPTATSCFGSGPNPAAAVMTVPPGTYVVTRTSTWNVPGLTTGANPVTVLGGDSVATDLTLFDPSTAGDVPTARDDTASARPGLGATVAVLANDSDPTDQPLTVEIVTPPSQGTATVTGDGRIAYLASSTATGTDTVGYAAVDPWGNRGEATVTLTIDPFAELAVSLTTDPAPPISRDVRFALVVTVRNTSATPAGGATVTVTLPAPVVYDAAAGAPASCSGPAVGATGTLACALGPLAANGTTTFRVPVRLVTRPASEVIAVDAVVSSADCADTDPDRRGIQCSSATLDVAVPRTPVTVSVSSSVASVAPGGSFRYLVDVANGGPVRADVDLVMDLPPEAGMVGLGPLPGPASCTFTPALAGGSAGTPDVTTRCRFPLAAGATARFTIDVAALRVPATPTLDLVAAATSVDCTPGAATGAGPCGPAAAGGPTVIAAALRATYAQTQPAPGKDVRVGDTVRFRAGIRNDGTVAARLPQVQIQLPPELGMVGISQQPGVPFSCTFAPALGSQPTPRVLTSCGFQALAAGASVSFEIEARVLEVPVAPAAPVTVRVSSVDCADTSASAAGVQCDTIAEGPGVVRTTLAPAVTMTPANPAVGDTVSIAFTTQNTGTAPARSLRTRLVLPADLAMTALTEFTGASSCSFAPPLAGGGTPAVTTTCAHPDLAPGASNVVRVSAVVQSLPASGAFDVRGEVGSLDCRDLVSGDARRTCATALLPTPTTSLATSIGGLTLRVSTGTITSLQPIASSLLPVSPAGVAFPYGAMSFTVTDVDVGGSTELFLGVADRLAGYWKLTATGWSQYPTSRPVTGGMVLTLVDGGAGDADGVPNGIIVDPGAIGVPNQGPTVADVSVTTPPGTPVDVDVLASTTDPDGGVLEVASATNGRLGSVVATPGTVTYTPYAGATGQDSFTVTVSDGQGGEATATVAVTIAAPEPPPPTTTPDTSSTTSSPSTTAPGRAPVVPPTLPPSGRLPDTGSEPTGWAILAGLLVAAGLALVLRTRHRTSPCKESS